MEIEPIAHIHTAFPTKFGIPRQSGLVPELEGTIVFEPQYRDPDALRGISGFSHLWLLWGFSEAQRKDFSPLVRPPRLGGNEKRGVFATRSPFRPNSIGLSSVELVSVDQTNSQGTVLRVRGADLMDGTPIYDIKPYISYTDVHKDAVCGFASNPDEGLLDVVIPAEYEQVLGPDAEVLSKVLERDPRPAYHNDPDRVYEMRFSCWDVRFKVAEGTLTVVSVKRA